MSFEHMVSRRGAVNSLLAVAIAPTLSPMFPAFIGKSNGFKPAIPISGSPSLYGTANPAMLEAIREWNEMQRAFLEPLINRTLSLLSPTNVTAKTGSQF